MTDIKRLFDFPYYQLKHKPTDKALVTKYNGKWTPMSTQEYIDKANTISRALLRLGVQKDDKIAVISSTNRTEWNIMDIGILQTGAQNIPIYPTISAEDYEYVLNHSESTYCFVSDEEVLEKVRKVQANTKLKEVYSFNHIDGCKHYSELFELGKDKSNQNEVEVRKDAVKPDDLATIIYTSGTTGRPKGVMLSHWNITSNALDSSKRLPKIDGETRILSFLPICHIFERVLIYIYQYAGTSIYFAEGLDKIGDNAKEIKPHLMSVVPRLLEKVFDKIMLKADELSGIKQKLFYWAVELGEQWEPYKTNGAWYEFKLSIANKLIFSKWREALGGELTTMVSGSAALQPRLSRIFGAAKMQVMEGYGLTETSPVVGVGMYRDNCYKVGTVGKPIDNVEVKIAEDGEILIKGPNVMLGYYKDPEKTDSVMTDNYFHTGDKGIIDEDGFLKITGRKKEMFKTSGGKYIIPTLLENDLKQSLFIEQVMVVGEGEKMPGAIIQPNFDFIRDWIDHKNLNIGKSESEIATSDIVINRIQKEVDKYNKHFGKWEQIKRFELTPEAWTIDDGHLTPTMKMKRSIIREKYDALYEKIYRPNAQDFTKNNILYYACIIFLNLLCMHSIFYYLWNPNKILMKDKTIDYVLRTTWLAVNKMYNEEASKFDTTMATGFALLSIDPENGTPSTSLGPKMGMEATSLSRTLKSMEEKGLIERKPNPEDGRGVLIHLTEFGREKRTYSRERVLTFNEAIKSNISSEKIESFYEVAELINNMISNKKIYNQKEHILKQ